MRNQRRGWKNNPTSHSTIHPSCGKRSTLFASRWHVKCFIPDSLSPKRCFIAARLQIPGQLKILTLESHTRQVRYLAGEKVGGPVGGFEDMAAGQGHWKAQEPKRSPHLSSGQGKNFVFSHSIQPATRTRFFSGQGLWIITLARSGVEKDDAREEDAFVFIALFTLFGYRERN